MEQRQVDFKIAGEQTTVFPLSGLISAEENLPISNIYRIGTLGAILPETGEETGRQDL